MMPMWYKYLLLTCVFPLCLIAQETNQDEALFVRRLVEFWRDGETNIVKSQSQDFLEKFPDGKFRENVHLIIGNIFLKEGALEQARHHFELIKNRELQAKILLSYLYCLYALKDFNTLAVKTADVLADTDMMKTLDQNPLLLFYKAESMYRPAIEAQQEDPEQLKQVASNVLPLYEALINTTHKENALVSLAEIHKILGNNTAAAEQYLQLAELRPAEKESLQYQAAVAFSTEKPTSAEALFEELASQDGKCSQDAAYRLAALLYHGNKFEELIEKREFFVSKITADRQIDLKLFLGGAHFQLKHYSLSIAELKPLTKTPSLPREDYKNVLLVLASSAHHINDMDTILAATAAFQETFPQAPELAHVLFIRALAYQQSNVDLSLQDLDKIFFSFPNYSEREQVAYLRANALYALSQWSRTQQAYKAFIQEFPQSRHIIYAYRYMLNAALCHLKEVQNSDDKQALSLLRQQLLSDIDTTLKHKEELPKDEIPKYELEWAILLLEEGKTEDSLDMFRNYLRKYPNSPDIYKVHFFMALCYQDKENQNTAFAFHAEQALALHPGIPEGNKLHLHLFNLYLRLAKEESSKETPQALIRQEEYTHSAADHLYEVIADGSHPIERQKRLWLAHYYYKLLQNSAPTENTHIASKLKVVLCQLLNFSETKSFVLIEKDEQFLEMEVYRLAHVLGILGEKEKEISLLEGLLKQYQENPDWGWRWKTQTHFLLAQAYEIASKPSLAIKQYRIVESFGLDINKEIFSKTRLQLARLLFLELKGTSQDNLNSKDVEYILNILKELQIRKSLTQEPVHLEAAMDYADIRSYYENPDKKDAKLLSLLQRMKEEFTSQDDISSRDYHARRELIPEKNAIYQSYIMLLDARIAQLKAKVSYSKGRIHESDSYREASGTILTTLLEDKFALSQYIVDHAKKELQLLGKNANTASE